MKIRRDKLAVALLLVLAVSAAQVSAGTFWHFTDPHGDWLYKPGTKEKQKLCRVGKGNAGEFG